MQSVSHSVQLTDDNLAVFQFYAAEIAFISFMIAFFSFMIAFFSFNPPSKNVLSSGSRKQTQHTVAGVWCVRRHRAAVPPWL